MNAFRFLPVYSKGTCSRQLYNKPSHRPVFFFQMPCLFRNYTFIQAISLIVRHTIRTARFMLLIFVTQSVKFL